MSGWFRTLRRWCAALVAVPIACFLAVPAVAADPQQCFRVFDATLYIDKPDLRPRGLEPANVFEPDRWWPKGPHDDDLPDPSAPQTWIRTITAKQGVLVLDLERWWLRGEDAPVQEAMRRYITVFDWIRAAGYSAPMGYYGTLPTYNPPDAVQSVNSPGYAAWRKENDRVQPLADRVDILFPSLYTESEDVEGWVKLATATLREARRLAHGKPVFPFIWPQYAGAKPPLGLKYMPGSQWARELEVVGANADGVVIWGGIAASKEAGPSKWDESYPWWQATLAFLARHKACSSAL